MPQKERLEAIRRHLSGHENQTENKPHITQNSIPKKRQELLKWNGWGYKDSKFILDEKMEMVQFLGNRYPIANKNFPNFKKWIEEALQISFTSHPSRPEYKDEDLPKPILDDAFLQDFKPLNIDHSFDPQDRLFRAHGHTMREIFNLRGGHFDRIPDLVVWPRCHDDVASIVEAAAKNNVVIIPFGGGTSVSGAVECPAHEQRMIVSLDTSQMNRILWVNKDNNTALVEAGIIGQDLERELAKFGLVSGHEPDSYEFSSLGGWVATRASGMKKNIYGNIEDMLVHVRMVTPKGEVSKNCQVPRISSGPDIHQFILGSEGTLGVVTEVVIRVKPTPECRRYGSVAFRCFEDGMGFLQECSRQNLRPASIRLVDNAQVSFGLALKHETGFIKSTIEELVKLFLTVVKGIDMKKIAVTTLLFEGRKEEVDNQEKRIMAVASRFGGISGGEDLGKRGYMLTFVIAYIRDLGFEYGILAESFETSVPWDRVTDLVRNVKDRIDRECKSYGLQHTMTSCRVTQSYDVGACVYFYFAFGYMGIKDPVHVYESIEASARDEIIESGGSISHHHGVGKLRKRWMAQSVSDVGINMIRAVKQSVDPMNIFASGNLIE